MNRHARRLVSSLSRFAAVFVFVAAGCDGGGSTARDAGSDARDAGKSGGRTGTDAASSGGASGTDGPVAGTGGSSGGASGATGGTSGAGGGEGGSVGSGGMMMGSGGRSGTGGATPGSGGAGGALGTGGAGGHGMTGAGERPGGTGGAHTGGMTATGGAGTGTGGTVVGTGGMGTGGMVSGTGGAGTGGAGTGGAGTGGAGTGGAGTGGAGTGGAATGGHGTGGAGTGGANTGGAATGGRGTGGAGTGGAASGGAGGGGGASLYVVAHPDDDLLFINPYIETDIRAGRRVTTVYVTSGDGSDGPFPNREPRIMSAGAAMAGVDDEWQCAMQAIAGKSVKACWLTDKPLVGVIFLRLTDAAVMNLRSGARVNTADGATSYNEAELLAVLQAIIVDVQPVRVGTLDATLLDNGDVEHSDHVASAMYTMDAARSDGVARQLLLFRGYTTFFDPPPPAHEPQNLTNAEYVEKRRVMVVYLQGDDGAADTYEDWLRRTYPYTGSSPGTVTLQHGSQCLEASGTAAGSAVHMAACNAAAAQTWTVGANSRVVGAGGLCLGTSGSAAQVQTCDNSAGQRWTLLSSGQLRGVREGCLNASGTTVTSADCEGTTDSANKFVPVAAQRWTAAP